MSDLIVNGLRVWFPGEKKHEISVVRDVSFRAEAGKTIGIAGESGSGKSMTALAMLGLVPFPGKIEGSIRLNGRELVGLPESEYQKIRGKAISIVFQDPSTALDPVFTIEQQLVETLLMHREISRQEAREQAVESLRGVDIPNPEKRIKDYPHQFSGGMKQRILIAMALSCEPDVLILDEPTTALDVTVQAQILDLIERIQNLNKTSIILISHDLGIVSEISDEVGIMYAGKLVEYGQVQDVLQNPYHPYTKGLLNSIPCLGIHKQRLEAIQGFPPNPSDMPSGCPFHPRCKRKTEKCFFHDPPITKNRVAYACWNPESRNE